MPETSLEQVVDERRFAAALQEQSASFFRLCNTLLAPGAARWHKRHYFQLISEAEALESFLDDYGARYNRTYCFFTELIASVRGFALAGYSIAHLMGRLDSYNLGLSRNAAGMQGASRSIDDCWTFINHSIRDMLLACRGEAERLGMHVSREALPEASFKPLIAKQKLPRNVDQTEPQDDRQKAAEVASKYLQACEMLEELGVRRLSDPEERRAFLLSHCNEEQARVYEATVHNLQSAYDTHLKSSQIESGDERLGRLRGHVSAALHLLESVTYLTHFYERHETDLRSNEAKVRIGMIVDKVRVQDMILNHLLFWADLFMQSGRPVAEAVLPQYTNAQELTVELGEELELHARPASLIVGIVNHYGTPVEMEVAGRRCNAASILELLVTVGSHPGEKRYVFRGDEKPLADIATLFRYGLGEMGIDQLPSQLAYLRSK
ncbi:MAG: HPr family phosphocarrier protein [Planctomycetes bacterium]|nr:HPr family phosphocarrier protein [Planctomycetota bacterium]